MYWVALETFTCSHKSGLLCKLISGHLTCTAAPRAITSSGALVSSSCDAEKRDANRDRTRRTRLDPPHSTTCQKQTPTTCEQLQHTQEQAHSNHIYKGCGNISVPIFYQTENCWIIRCRIIEGKAHKSCASRNSALGIFINKFQAALR